MPPGDEDRETKAFTECLVVIQRRPGFYPNYVGSVPIDPLTGWEIFETVSEIWLPIKIRTEEEWQSILKEHRGDRWQATSECR